MNDLLKEAIADAKAVRATALANAKVALTEAFTPRLQSMLSARLAQEAEEEDGPEMEEEKYMDDGKKGAPADDMEEGDDMGDEEELEKEARFGEAEEDEENPEEVEEEGLDLEAIIRELEAELEGRRIAEEDDEEGDEEVDEVYESHGSSNIGKGENTKSAADKASTDDPGKGKLKEAEGDDDDESVNEIESYLNELIAEMEGEDKKDDDKTVDEVQKELAEAYTVIQFLRDKINEVSLMNSKLLFSTRIFKDFDLTSAQKEKVLENFDRAMTVRETKLIYTTLCENMNVRRKAKAKIQESAGSKIVKSTAPSKQVISESRKFVERFQELANIKKK